MPSGSQRVFEFGPFQLDADGQVLHRDGKRVPLAPKLLETLLALVEKRGQVVDKDALLRKVWPDTFVEETNLARNVSLLRKVLADNGNGPEMIETIPTRGYVFVGEVREYSGREVSRTPAPSVSDPTGTTASAYRAIGLAVVVVFLVALSFTVITLWSKRGLNAEHLEFTKLTDSAKVENVGISPDGRYVAYVLHNRAGQGLWLRQVAAPSSDIQVVPPEEAFDYWGLTFSPDGNYIYFVRSDNDAPNVRSLYMIPTLGGRTRFLLKSIDSRISFSPDGLQFVFTRGIPSRNVVEIRIANTDGTGEKVLAIMKDAAPLLVNMLDVAPIAPCAAQATWSPDGRTIAVSSFLLGNHARWRLSAVSVESGRVRELYTSDYKIGRPLWIPNSNGLLVMLDDETNEGQLWRIPFPHGVPQRLTHDLADYGDDFIDVTRDGKTLAIVQWSTTGHVWRAPAADLSKAEQIESGALALVNVASGPGGRLLTRGLDGQLWMMTADGSQRNLFTDVHNTGVPVSCGRFVVFTSFQRRAKGLLRADADGSNITTLATGYLLSATCSQDGKFIFYYNLDHPQKIQKLAIEGGTPIDVADLGTESIESRLGVSQDGRFVAYVSGDDSEHKQAEWRLVVIPASGGQPIKTWKVPVEVGGVVWSPKGESLQYSQLRNGAENIWEQPLAGGNPKQLTKFTASRINDFNWSADGQHLLMTRGDWNGDIVLLSIFR